MFERIWNFAKRHRKKLIASAVVTGGAYYAYRVFLPRLQELLLQRLLGGSEGLNELLELAARGEESERKPGEDKRLRFEHKQQVSDAHVRRKLAALRTRHNVCFSVEECTKRLQEAKASNDRKAEAFAAFQVECLARVSSALYTLHVLLLLHRVEFNIVGRELTVRSPPAAPADGAAGASAEQAAEAADDEGTGVFTAFLESIDHIGENCLNHISETIRRAVKSCTERAQLQPQTAVTAATLQQLLLDVCREADGELLAETRGAATLLPESLDKAILQRHGLAEAPQREATRLLDEARDYLESPQFLAVFQASVATAVKRLVGSLGSDGSEAGSPLADGASCPLAKLCGRLVALSNVLLDEDGAATHIAGFAEEASVGEFCEMLYFQEQTSAMAATTE